MHEMVQRRGLLAFWKYWLRDGQDSKEGQSCLTPLMPPLLACPYLIDSHPSFIFRQEAAMHCKGPALMSYINVCLLSSNAGQQGIA